MKTDLLIFDKIFYSYLLAIFLVVLIWLAR